MHGNLEFTQNSKTKFNDSEKDTHGFIVNETYMMRKKKMKINLNFSFNPFNSSQMK